jgi:TetR/AcrR family transcriptional regulator, ethionamide resistance regulator
MTTPPPTTPTTRRRRRRDDARRQILEAAAALLETQPWNEISLEQIMAGANLSRTTFYRHFEDRQLLLLAMLDELEVDLNEAGRPWKEGGEDPVGDLVRGLRTLTDTYVQHGRLLQAIADAATQDPDVRATYQALGDDLVATTAERIALEVQAGCSEVADPLEVARALVWMSERYLMQRFGRAPAEQPDSAAAALADVWTATIYGRPPARD